MLAECAQLIGGKKIGAWESGFLTHVLAIAEGRGTTAFTPNQAACLTRIYHEQF